MAGTNELIDEDYSFWSDLHKDVYGFRPRFNRRFESVESYRAEMGRLSEELEHRMRLDRAREYRRMRNILAEIRSLMKEHQCMLWQAVDGYLHRESGDWRYRQEPQDFEQIMWKLDIPHSWWKRVRAYCYRDDLIDFE